jgi:hypothetical protein
LIELQTHFDEFRIVVVEQIGELTALRPEAQTTEWYSLKCLRRVHKKVIVSTSPREVENTIRALIRFYLDAIDEGSELELRCKNVLQSHRCSLRLERRA